MVGGPMVEAKMSVFGLVGWNQPQVFALPLGETRRMFSTPVISPLSPLSEPPVSRTTSHTYIA